MRKRVRAKQPLPGKALEFPEGLPGFENLRRFLLLEDQELLPIVFLASVAEPRVCLPVLPVHRLRPDYRLVLTEEDRRTLRLPAEQAESNTLCLAVLHLGEPPQPPTANLLAPIVVNVEAWVAKQVIQAASGYPIAAEVA